MDEAKKDEIRDYFRAAGVLSSVMEDYELRCGQMEMAEAVHDAIQNENHVLTVEAGTGIGKSLAYIIPLALSRKKCIVSTYTIALQDQLIKKELPFVADIMPFRLTYSVLKGRTNYLCPRRFINFNKTERAEYRQDKVNKFHKWAIGTSTGDCAELKEMPVFWSRVCSVLEDCDGKDCVFRKPLSDSKNREDVLFGDAAELKCFYDDQRNRARDKNIVVVNHALYFTNHRTGKAVFNKPEIVVFDEAHMIEKSLSGAFGATLTTKRLSFLIEMCAERCEREADKWSETGNDIKRAFGSLLGVVASNGFEIPAEMPPDLEDCIFAVKELIKSVNSGNDASTERDPAEALRSMEEFCNDLEEFWFPDSDYTYYSEAKDYGIILQKQLVDCRGVFPETIHDTTAIMTSATLSANRNFIYFKTWIGMKEEGEELLLESPFDYKKQAVLFLPLEMPDPNDLLFSEYAARQIYELVTISGGNAFVLSTSIKNMKHYHAFLAERMENVMLQGEASVDKLISRFKNTPNAVLVGTRTLWSGVDVPGEDLQMVIIDKIPFTPPGEKIFSEKSKLLEASGGNPFREISIPEAVMTLKQGFGRLIRASSDRGVIAILDSRIRKKGYGKIIVDSLPSTTITNRIEDISDFYEKERRNTANS